MNTQYFFTTLDVRTVNNNPTIETPGAQKSRIENVRTVRRCDQNDTIVRLEAVHLHEKLIQSLLTLVVPPAKARAAMAPYSINLVDKNDAWSILLPLFEQVADAACANPDEHFHEVRTGY